MGSAEKLTFLRVYHSLEEKKFEIIDLLSRNQSAVLSGRQVRVSYLLTKLLAHVDTLINIVQNHFQYKIDQRKRLKFKKTRFFPFDHHSICSLGRVCYDAALMLHYVSEPSLEISQWNLRRKILYLHDLTNRHRFLKTADKISSEGSDSFSYLKKYKSGIVDDIICHLDELGLDHDPRYTNGQIVFIDGVRGAVREAGWDLDKYEFRQVYLSNYIHSHPVSFIRALDHQVDFEDPSPAQFAAALVGVESAHSVASSTIQRCGIFLLPGGDPLAKYFDADGMQKEGKYNL